MTFEEFRELALNPLWRERDTNFFAVIEYGVRDLSGRKRQHYPKFDVRHFLCRIR